MKIGFVMDPIEGVDVFADTTFALMLGAQNRGHEVYYIRPRDLVARGDKAFSICYPVTLRPDPKDKVSYGQVREMALHEFDCLWMRKDPPFDVPYLYEVGILELAQERGTLVLNEPDGLRAANEKLYALHFADVIPDTLVTNQAGQIKEFMANHDGMCVLKPLSGHGGEGIFVLSQGDRNLNALIEMSTSHGRAHIMCQQYLPEAREGDKRILMLNGKSMGAILRVPKEEEHRSNIHVGGQVQKTTLSEEERHICDIVGPRLVRDGLYFVGLDVIGGRLTEINVTSPTGIQEMSRLDDVDGPAMVMEWIEGEI